ncbi:hypothetical protein CcaverHIS002_0704170 [Cutaneotrichosporon cavernicola]|uniref:Uncharacterized protein n=1 Tax=Cutaneotrichosporon cavernicola TaxID=279322 RepID=A0AA48QYM7_9TREE|nr:uncharacterized protein CcaverHIS019_0704250 [Cutaneotrichosporon cavernicola]BEI87071.1 hypothetical protein CcaverHIS002_0704170 [Cutaneotrichosporon cavernicola]BEI94844.1 hypothetical protein CcaverHIS019_0704250 [Cutaneotrichosporon cavernicola]BEJ02618.1 hypothetical protein CcaverHIS631_0704130 [Cutaneotrichosporon cavernicola]BEJ10374.1 hypothetical protein CcaverHIS641_0704090 [Cutaneotrichosporon cavernicola]
MSSPTKEHRFTLSDYDYLVDAVSTQPSSGVTSPGAMSPTSATSPTTRGFRPLPNIPRVTSPTSTGAPTPMEGILGPGPAPIPASPEQPPSRASSSSSSPPGMGPTYPPRIYQAHFGVGVLPPPAHGPTSPPVSRPPFVSGGSNSSLNYARGPTYHPTYGPNYPSSQPSTDYAPSRQPGSGGFAGHQLMHQRHPMETQIPDTETVLSPLSADRRLSMVSEPGEEKDGHEEKAVAQPVRNSYVPPKAPNKWIDGFWPKNTAIRALIIITFLEAVIDIAIQANLLWRYDQEISDDSGDPNGRRLRIFLVVFILAHITQVTLTLWAVFYRNTIQIVGLAIFNCLLLIYAAIQVGEIAEVLGTHTDGNAHTDHKIFSLPTKILSGLVIAVIAIAQIAYIFLAWSIWKEFGWRIYRFLGADLQIRRYYRQYQIFECILCFTFFFVLGFGVQFIFMVLRGDQPEKYITIIMLPLSVVWLVFGAIAGRWELAWLMGIFIFGMHGAVAYFIYKMVRIWTQSSRFEGVKMSLTIFSVLALAMIVLCIVFAIIVWRNFGKGLKRATGWRRKGHGHTPSDEMNFGQTADGSYRLQHRLTIE